MCFLRPPLCCVLLLGLDFNPTKPAQETDGEFETMSANIFLSSVLIRIFIYFLHQLSRVQLK